MSGLPEPRDPPGVDCEFCKLVNPITPLFFNYTFEGVRNEFQPGLRIDGFGEMKQTALFSCQYDPVRPFTPNAGSFLYGSATPPAGHATVNINIPGNFIIFTGTNAPGCKLDQTFDNDFTEEFPSTDGYFGGTCIVKDGSLGESIGIQLIKSGLIPNAKKARWNRSGVPADGPPGATFLAVPPDSFAGADSIDSNTRVDLVVSRRDKTRVNIKYDAT